MLFGFTVVRPIHYVIWLYYSRAYLLCYLALLWSGLSSMSDSSPGPLSIKGLKDHFPLTQRFLVPLDRMNVVASGDLSAAPKLMGTHLYNAHCHLTMSN